MLSRDGVTGMIRLAAVFYGVTLGVAAFLTFLWGRWSDWYAILASSESIDLPSWLSDYPTLAIHGTQAVEDLGIGLVIGLGLVVFSQWLSPRLKWGQQLTEEFARVFGPMGWGACFVLALLSGVAEEALFRTTLQPMLARGIHSPILSWILVSLLFGLVHTGPKRHYMIWTVFAVVFGLIVGGLHLWRGGLLVPATVHITVNLFNLKWIANHAPKKPIPDDPLASQQTT